MKIGNWNNEPPTKPGLYWHWREVGAVPVLLHVARALSTGKCFVEVRDDPLARNVDDPAHEGWWHENMPPDTPNLSPTPGAVEPFDGDLNALTLN